MCSAVLATAAEEDDGGREGERKRAAEEGEGRQLLYGSSIDTSQYLMEMDLFR